MTSSASATDPDAATIGVRTAARYLGVSERTIRRLVASRAISHRRVAGLVRFTNEDIEDYLRRVLVVAET
jgi:excisionase family DNA binding protein